jgi:hypothetical protein
MTALEKHLCEGLPELEKQFRAEMMTKIDNVVCELESRGDFSNSKYPEVSIDNYKRVALQYLDQALEHVTLISNNYIAYLLKTTNESDDVLGDTRDANLKKILK